MTPQLAHELKDAGFPQGIPSKMTVYKEDGDMTVLSGVYFPTLSELISACGEDNWLTLRLSPTTKKEVKWVAIKSLTIDIHSSTNILESAFGSTPEEAVARLWLALNKKP